jgi:L,D-transpeptidase catalytic domain
LKKILTPLAACIITIALASSTTLRAGNNNPATHPVETAIIADSSGVEKSEEINLTDFVFEKLQLERLGLSREALEFAFRGYRNLLNKGALKNPDIITICDFSQSSTSKRLYVIDLKNYELLLNTYVAHGRNSGLDYAEKFSNNPDSHESSLGFYVTENAYIGEHGLSLRINGLDVGFNDNALERAIVVHGSVYVGDKRKNSGAIMGRSYGCPAVPQKQVKKLINSIKNGSCLFIYHPTKNYLDNSTILNG